MLNKRDYLLALVAILLFGAALRLINLLEAPPGIHFDEAANGLLTNGIAFDGKRPLFITSYTGKEVLFFYLGAGVMRLVDSSVWGLRLTAVYVGILTIAATYWLGIELSRNKRIALLAAAFIAISFWHILFSRLGFRAITQPLLQALMVAAWLRGARRQQTGWFVFSGICLGLSTYTYLAVRLFPILLLLAALPLLFGAFRQQWRNHLLLGGVALLVATPLLLFFVQHPETFWVRITQVATNEQAPLTVWESIRLSLQMFFLKGDPYIRFNLPLRPLFGPALGTSLLIGWLLLLIRWWQFKASWQKTAVLLLLLAPFIMLLPTALATDEIVPSNLRAIGLIPFIFYLPAIGFDWVLTQYKPDRLRRVVWRGMLALLFWIAAGNVGYSYFVQWGQDPALFVETDGDMAVAAALLDELAQDGETLFMASPHYQHPTVALLSGNYDQIKWLPQSQAIVFPAQGESLLLFPAKSPVPAWAAPYLPAPIVEETAVTAYRLQNQPSDIPTQINANFSNAITLLGYSLPDVADPARLPVSLFWSINGRLAENVQPFIHLEDQWGYRWSQRETFAYPAAQWTEGDLLIQYVELPISAGTPPGSYQIKVGLFDPETGRRLARLSENGRFEGNVVTIPDVPVVAMRPPAHFPPIAIQHDLPITDGLRLLGNDPILEKISSGEQLPIVLHWFASQPLPDLTMRFELLRDGAAGGRIVANNQPVHNQYPFPFWDAPHYVQDHQAIVIPESLDAGRYIVNLRMIDQSGDALTAVHLGTIEVEKTERLFTRPATDNSIIATFANEIQLEGYTLTPRNELEYDLTLLWRALQPPTTDYTVFVHLLHPDGSCTPCAWQQDIMPQQNGYPTSRWQTNEYVLDAYHITLPADLPAGIYSIEIGLYLADSGIRLEVESPIANTGDAIVIERIRK